MQYGLTWLLWIMIMLLGIGIPNQSRSTFSFFPILLTCFDHGAAAWRSRCRNSRWNMVKWSYTGTGYPPPALLITKPAPALRMTVPSLTWLVVGPFFGQTPCLQVQPVRLKDPHLRWWFCLLTCLHCRYCFRVCPPTAGCQVYDHVPCSANVNWMHVLIHILITYQYEVTGCSC